jgi:hypothetical protein
MFAASILKGYAESALSTLKENAQNVINDLKSNVKSNAAEALATASQLTNQTVSQLANQTAGGCANDDINILSLYFGSPTPTANLHIGNKAKYGIEHDIITCNVAKEEKERGENLFLTLKNSIIVCQDCDILEPISEDTQIERLRLKYYLHESLTQSARDFIFGSYIPYVENIIKRLMLADNINIEEKIAEWKAQDAESDSKSSSIILQYVNTVNSPSFKLLNEEINKSSWRYEGFCAKIPHKRLMSLMKFPVWSLPLNQKERSFILQVDDFIKLNPFNLLAESFQIENLKANATPDDVIEFLQKNAEALQNLENKYANFAKWLSRLTEFWNKNVQI